VIFSLKQIQGKNMNDIQKAVRTRLNRIARYGNKNKEVAKRLTETFTDEELVIAVEILTPLAGLKTSLFRATSQIYIANQKDERSFIKTIRGLITDAINIFKLSLRSKELYMYGIINGTISDDRKKSAVDETEDVQRELLKFHASHHYHKWALMRERVYLNKRHNTPPFPMYEKLLKHLDNIDAEDPFRNIMKDDDIDEDSRVYIKDVLDYAIRHSNQITILINAQFHEKCKFSNTPAAMYGDLSAYKKDIKEDEVPYDVLFAQVVYDLIIYTNADQNELRRLLEENIMMDMMKKKEAEKLEEK